MGYHPAMRAIGRALQATGLAVVLVGLIFGIERGPDAMALEIGFSLAGVALFLVGLQFQRKGS